ncbi:deferrochelatase/peroxidase EfeB [Streptosporangium subroseum]|uniref:Deferrochelatase/peroxidase EfeB n=1 Tax=Streptosporangium subroseum TaxID=106412 RepID=A0A239I2G9_9ACTN|nr:Dyp-type peroxidase [Streptosporangium subroseum]SNS87719.1 deferrochelatase/peroxidase EfeB [Streptosporangium subroseum]
MADERPPAQEAGRGGGECPAGAFGRRSFLQGTLAAGLVGAAGRSPPAGDAALADGARGGNAGTGAIPFHGYHQAGIATPPQPTGSFASFDVTASDRGELTELFRTLTARARFLTAGGTPPRAPPDSAQPDNDILGPKIPPDNLTITVALGATLFDGRYGLGPRRPVQLITMRPFRHDDLDPALSQGDMLIQLCADHRDTTVHALLDILAHTGGAMKPRWRIDCQRNPPRPVGTPRDWFGFKDGTSNPDTTDPTQMDQLVWAQPRTAEPAWAAGGTYQVLRIVHFNIEKWQKLPLAQQERIFGRRKDSGAPMYALSEDASDLLDPIYTNDPQGLITPLNSHIRLANPQTPQTAATSTILRRSYDYDRTLDVRGGLDLGHAFCCFQRELNTYITMQNRLEGEALVPYISPRGGGYFFALPGVRDDQDHYARELLT